MARFPSTKAGRTALGGVMAAGSLVFLWAASLTPTGRLGLTAVAGLFPMVAVLAGGRNAGYMCWAAAGILGSIMLPDKGVSVLFLSFLGLYPVIKSRIEALRRQPVEWCVKLVFFNLALSFFWLAFRELFLPNPPVWLADNSLLLYAMGNAIFILYDIGLSRLIALIRARFKFDKHT